MADYSGAAATVIGASIAAGIAFLGLVVSKEQRTSEFRQAWIDALREDLATYLSRINSAYDAARAGFKDRSELWKAVREDMINMTDASSRIMLRLNSGEEPSPRMRANSVHASASSLLPSSRVGPTSCNLAEPSESFGA